MEFIDLKSTMLEKFMKILLVKIRSQLILRKSVILKWDSGLMNIISRFPF